MRHVPPRLHNEDALTTDSDASRCVAARQFGRVTVLDVPFVSSKIVFIVIWFALLFDINHHISS